MTYSVIIIIVLLIGIFFLGYEFITLRMINDEKSRKFLARFLYLLLFVIVLVRIVDEYKKLRF
jgi:hypothetical protein